jgi:hypothetical protein
MLTLTVLLTTLAAPFVVAVMSALAFLIVDAAGRGQLRPLRVASRTEQAGRPRGEARRTRRIAQARAR